MQTPITTYDKRAFIQWFLNQYQLKKRESSWILNYLVSHLKILTNIHFVRDAKFCPRGIIISSICSSETAFQFYKGHLVTMDADKAFHDIRFNQHEPLYIELNFNRSNQNSYYASVLEENPFTPDKYLFNDKEHNYADQLLNKSLKSVTKKLLIKEIDKALDNRNQTEFIKLTDKLNKLNNRE